jgi:hypothetical protein
VLRDHRDDLGVQTAAGLEEVLLGIVEAVLVIVAELRDDLSFSGCH